MSEQTTAFNDYAEALENAGPKSTELILNRAAHDREIDLDELRKLVSIAYRDPWA